MVEATQLLEDEVHGKEHASEAVSNISNFELFSYKLSHSLIVQF